MKKRTIAMGMCMIMLACSLWGCGSSEKKNDNDKASSKQTTEGGENAGLGEDGLDQAKKVTIGYNSTTWMWAIDQEYQFFEKEFEKYGIEVEWCLFDSGAAEKEAMSTNNLAFGSCGSVPVISAGAAELPVKVISKYNLDPAYVDILVPTDSDIKKVADLKGKKVACPVGTAEHAFLLIALEQAGLTADDVDMIALPKTEHLVALTQNEVDATITSGPHNLNAINDGLAVSILNSNGVFNNTAFIIASQEFIEENPKITEIFLTAWMKEMDCINSDMEGALEVVEKYVNADKESLEYGLQAVYDTDVSDFDTESLTQLKDLLLETDNIENDFDVESVYDFSYLEAAKEAYNKEK